MSTSTARLQLTKPDGTDLMSNGYSVLADAWQKIDDAMGVRKFTDQSAVANPYPGYLLRETTGGKSKVFIGSNTWVTLFDPNDGKGTPQDFDYDLDSTFANVEEFEVTSFIFTVVLGRKYKVDFSIALTARSPDVGIGGPYTLHGYVRNNFKYTTNIDQTATNLVHDITTYVSKDTDAASKNLRGMFEFFPNYDGEVKITHTIQVLSGDEFIRINIANAGSNIIMTDWGI